MFSIKSTLQKVKVALSTPFYLNQVKSLQKHEDRNEFKSYVLAYYNEAYSFENEYYCHKLVVRILLIFDSFIKSTNFALILLHSFRRRTETTAFAVKETQ